MMSRLSLALSQRWKKLDINKKALVIAEGCLGGYILVRAVLMLLIVVYGASSSGVGLGYKQRHYPGSMAKSIGIYRFVAENGKEYSARFTARSSYFWPRETLIFYQRNFPYNHMRGRPTWRKFFWECAPVLVLGLFFPCFEWARQRKWRWRKRPTLHRAPPTRRKRN